MKKERCAGLAWLMTLGWLVSLPYCSAGDAAPLPLLVGHRGLLHQAPENTLAGFAACLELRVGFELDIRRTKDGHLVCLHDDDLRRTTNGKGSVAEFTLAELQQLDAGRGFDPSFAG